MAFSIDNILSDKNKTQIDNLMPPLPKYDSPFTSPHITAASTINRDLKSHLMAMSAHQDSQAAFFSQPVHPTTAGLLLAQQNLPAAPHPALTSPTAGQHPAAGLFSPTAPWKMDTAELLYHNLYIDSILQGIVV